MPSVPVSTLLTRIDDITDNDNPNWVSETMKLRWLNAARPRLDSVIARAGWPLNISLYTVSATGAPAYDTAVQVMAVAGVFEYKDGRYRSLRNGHVMDRRTDVAGDAREFVVYDTGGTTRIEFRPAPATGTYRVYYLPQPLVMVTGSPGVGQESSVNYPSGWEEWMVLEAARQAHGREEAENANVERRIREIERDIERMASDRLFGQGPRVRDVRASQEDHWSISAMLDSGNNWVWL